MDKERVYVIRGPKGRAGKFLTGTATFAGEWGSRRSALRGDLAWATYAARTHGGTVDAAGWADRPESPVAGFVSDRQYRQERREALERGAAERAARKDGNFFGSW